MSTQPLVTKTEALEIVTKAIDTSGIDVDTLLECFKWQAKLALWVLQERQTQPTITQLIEQLTIAKTVPDISRITAQLLKACGVYNTQGVGLEIARMNVTSGLGKN